MGHNFRDPEVSQLDKQLPSKNSRNLYPNVLMVTEEIKTKCKKHHKVPLNFSFDFAGSKSRE
jgi:hypothetical protein